MTNYATNEGEIQLLEYYLHTAFHFDQSRDFAKQPLILIAEHATRVSEYFFQQWLGLPALSPAVNLSRWWRSLVLRAQNVRNPHWTQLALALLDTPRTIQDALESEIRGIADQLVKNSVTADYRRIVKPIDQHLWARFYIVGLVYAHMDERRVAVLRKDGIHSRNVMGDAFAVGIGVNALNWAYPCEFLIEA